MGEPTKSPEENFARSAELLRSAEMGGLQFMRTELETALTFATMAQRAEVNSDKRVRNQANARKAYDTLLNWRTRFATTQSMQHGLEELEPAFEQLKRILQELGEQL